MQLSEYLEREEITQTEFAGRVKVSQGMVWQWLNKRRPVAAEKVLAIETATGGEVSRHELRPDIYPRDQTTV
jgi:DNA-binding transcriptional regulator YdaS (Cro superfamily)